ncbi:chymotrypsinogen A [Drosophila willistoni]|uniref:chymotrypsinogen A n=1 Tax=Drosophila willistoni TaxID=7260 RepID=UPI000C26C380|nr:chymotrypsinogen A [Drosophila willistoni]
MFFRIQILILLSIICYSHSLGYLRIMNGLRAKERQLPYQVGIISYFDNALNDVSLCGGSILNTQWILTAAHCMQEPDSKLVKVSVFLGRSKMSVNKEIAINIRDIRVHKKFNRLSVANDIALIKLPRQLKFNSLIKPIKLPSNANDDYTNRTAIFSGWGLTAKQEASDSLQYQRAKVISNEQCEMEWNHQLKNGANKLVLSSFICIESNNGLPCRGDSGGPLVLDDGTRTLIGIVSHGYDEKCLMKVPDILTRVSSFLDWITEVTEGKL